MRPALFQTALESGATRCDVCQWRCELLPSAAGRCGVRRNIADVIQNEADELISAAGIKPIEELRMWHFFPDAQSFTIGSYGTPLRKQTSQYANLPPEGSRRVISAERIVDTALQRLCRGVMWSYNDPVISLEWLLDGLKLARASSRFTAISSYGFWTPEALLAVGPYLDGLRLDLLGFSDGAYRELGGMGSNWRGVLAAAAKLRTTWNTHIEVTLTLQTGINDAPEDLRALGTWVAGTLGTLTPLHLLLPADRQSDTVAAVAAAREGGLHFVYGPEPHQATRCPTCTWVVIERGDGPTETVGVINGMCESCGTPLGLRTSIFQRQTVYRKE